MALAAGTTTVYIPAASGGTAAWGTTVRYFSASTSGSGASTSTQDHGTNILVQAVRTVIPYAASSADATEADYGWAIDPSTGSNGMGATATMHRHMLAGNHVVTARMSSNRASVSLTLTAYIYHVGVSPSYTRTLIASGSVTAATGATNNESTFTITVACGRIDFAAGETYQVSVEASCVGNLIFTRVNTFRTGLSGGVQVRVDFPALSNDYLRAPADSAGVTDAVTRKYTGHRTAADATAAPSDGVARRITGGRTLAVTVPTPTDAVVRRMSRVRPVADTVTAVTDAITRQAVCARTVQDTTTVNDAVERDLTYGRILADAAPSTDAVSRVLHFVRQWSDATTAADVLDRAFVGYRRLADTDAVPGDAIVRAVTQRRSLADTTTAADALARQTDIFRTLADTNSTSDAIARVRIARRALGDTTAVTDAVDREYTGARTLADAPPPPADAMRRDLIYGRTLADDLTNGSSTITYRPIYLFDD